jgi:hypothetical protein
VNETNDTLQRLDMSVAPNAKIMRADAALRQDRSRFGHYQSRAADRATAEMDEMPVVSQTVAARVLTHWRDKDAVGELQIANRERIEQVSHTNTVDWHIALGQFGLTENSATEIAAGADVPVSWHTTHRTISSALLALLLWCFSRTIARGNGFTAL